MNRRKAAAVIVITLASLMSCFIYIMASSYVTEVESVFQSNITMGGIAITQIETANASARIFYHVNNPARNDVVFNLAVINFYLNGEHLGKYNFHFLEKRVMAESNITISSEVLFQEYTTPTEPPYISIQQMKIIMDAYENSKWNWQVDVSIHFKTNFLTLKKIIRTTHLNWSGTS